MGNTYSRRQRRSFSDIGACTMINSLYNYLINHVHADKLIIECRRGNRDAVEVLLGRVGNHTNTFEALLATCNKGHLEIVRLLITKGTNVNETNHEYWSALMIASQNGHYNIVKCLLSHGAVVDAQNAFGSSSLMLASQSGHQNIVELLIAEGAQVNKENKDGVTSLISASSKGHVEIAQILIKNGADVNVRGKNEESALSTAIHYAHSAVVQLLITHNAIIDDSTREKAENRRNEIGDIEKMLQLGGRNPKMCGGNIMLAHYYPSYALCIYTCTYAEKASVNRVAENEGVQPKHLDQFFSKDLLTKIASLVPNWLEYAHSLRLTEQEINGIRTSASSFRMKNQEMLKIWYQMSVYSKFGTYRALLEVFCELERPDVAGEICKVLKGELQLLKRNINFNMPLMLQVKYVRHVKVSYNY